MLDTETFRFIIYIWYEGGTLTPFLVPRGDERRHRVSVPGGSHSDARERLRSNPNMKGGITRHGEESQGREEEGRQEAVTSPVRKKGGGRRPLFTFLAVPPHPRPHSHPWPRRRSSADYTDTQIEYGDGCIPRTDQRVRRPAPRRSQSNPCNRRNPWIT